MPTTDAGSGSKKSIKKKKGPPTPEETPLVTLVPPKDQPGPVTTEDRKESPTNNSSKSDKKKKITDKLAEDARNESRENESGESVGKPVKPPKKKKKLSTRSGATGGSASGISGGAGDGSGAGTTASGESEKPGTGETEKDKWEKQFSARLTGVNSAFRLNLKRYNDMMAQMEVNEDDFSYVFPLRRYHSEPCFVGDLEERIELRPGSPIPEKCPSMEDLILSRSCYPELMMEHRMEEVDMRQYDVSADMMVEWNALFEMEKTRFSFFDELFAQGCVVDSMEVPGRDDNIEYLVEADPVDFRNKVDYARLVFKTKHVFTGNMVDWYFTGEGRYCWVDGTTYQGEFKNGVMHGDGVILWTDGSIYQGEFTEGIRNGYGIYSTAEGYTYAGDWHHGLPQGKGRMWYDPTVDDSDYYDGEWKECVPHGYGTRQYINGDRYTGNYENGIRSGHGTMIWLEERQVYKGDWANGLPHGNGSHTWYLARTGGSDFPTRHVYKGEWFEGTRHGVGRQIYACGSIYEGRWVRGQRHGKGVFVNPAGEVIFGLFRLGSIAGGSDVPLHAPTYACKFDNLIRTVAKTIYITPGTEVFQEMGLHETVIRFLPHIRRLFKRAGYLGESWGNQGHYPKWLSKPPPEIQHSKAPLDQHIRKHNVTEHTDHHHDEHGHKAHRGSPDNVHPLTRFGLWLFMKDCPGVLKDVTLAEFDRAWNAVASISFQTKHNPFEPVYLHQFLQCLVIMAQIIYYEVPKKKERKNAKKLTSNTVLQDVPTVSPADSYTKIKTSQTSLIGEVEDEEEGEGHEEEEEEEEPPEIAKSERAPSVKPDPKVTGAKGQGKAKPGPVKVKPFEARSKLKKDVPGIKKPATGPTAKKKGFGVLGKKPVKAESAPPILVNEMEGEDAEEELGEDMGEFEYDGETEMPRTRESLEGEGEEEELTDPKLGEQVGKGKGRKKSKIRLLSKEGKQSKKLVDKASKRFGVGSEKPGKRRKGTDGTSETAENPEIIDPDRKSDTKESDTKAESEYERKKAKSNARVKGRRGEKGENPEKDKKAKKAASSKNVKAKQRASAESEEQEQETSVEGVEEAGEYDMESRRNSAESQPGEQEPPRKASGGSEKQKQAETEPHKSEHSGSHHKGKRRGSVGKAAGTKKSQHKSNSIASTKTKYKKHTKKSLDDPLELTKRRKSTGQLSNAPEIEEEEDDEEEEETDEEEMMDKAPESRKKSEPKFWTESEVQLNTEERMYGWTGANKAKCKKHIQKQAEKHRTVEPGSMDIKIAELFERLLTDILLPCLERAPGMYLPEVPDPLPPLADLYYTFSNTYGNREVINAMDFTQSMLPHLLYPHKNDAIFWNRTKEVQSPQIDLDWVLNYHKLHAVDPEETVLGEDFLGERLANTKIFSEEIKENVRASFQKDQPRKSFQEEKSRGSIDIIGRGNTVFGDEIDGASVLVDYTPIKTPEGSSTSININKVDSLEELENEFPFSERDLAPEPFLWDRETKCHHIPRKEVAFNNLAAEDIVKVLRQLYPEIIGRAAETNMGLELSFCDWLWASTMVVKVSADRAFYSSMKHRSTLEHLHRPHHHPNTFGFHPNEAPVSALNKGSVFKHQSTLTDLREKYTRSDLRKSDSASYNQVTTGELQMLQ